MDAEAQPLLTRVPSGTQVISLKPDGSVTSLFCFMPPSVQDKNSDDLQRRKWTRVFAIFLVVLNYLMQFGLLYAVSFRVVARFEKWSDGTIELDGGSCTSGKAICTDYAGQYTCGPRSLQVYGRWDELDLNKDGTWTYAEASNQAFRDKMNCELGIDSLWVYNSVIKQLRSNAMLIKTKRVHASLTSRMEESSIHKAYFDWLKGDIVMCAFNDADMCGNMFQKGVFDAPLEYIGVSKMINSTQSAWEYCFNLLKAQGRCETTLPSTYSVWRAETNSRCGAKSFTPFLYTNQADKTDFISLLRVDYANRESYEETLAWHFKLFLWVILFIFYSVALNELRENLSLSMWVHSVPHRTMPGEGSSGPGDQCDVKGISRSHRMLCYGLVVLKWFMLVVMVVVGTTFLLSQTSYMNLLFDALSINFILELDKLLYRNLVPPQTQEEFEGIEPVAVITGVLCPSMSRDTCDTLWAVSLAALTVAVLAWNFYFHKVPLLKALECACHLNGEECFEATTYSRQWWNHYWRVEVPATYQAIDRLVGQVGTA